MKGTIDFLGFRVSAEIVVNPPEKLLVDVQLSPIDWAGGLIQLRKNSTDAKNGPSAYILILEDSVTVKIHGYISLLGFSREIQIEVTDQSFKFRIEEKLWTILSCSLEVEASYGSLASLSFSVSAISLPGFLEKYKRLNSFCGGDFVSKFLISVHCKDEVLT